MPFQCLVVDDNERFLQVAKRLLEADGEVKVENATTIDSALRAVERQRPSVVLIDVSLGAGSGFDLVRILTDRHTGIARSIVIMSTRAEEDYEGLIADLALAGFIAKSDLSAAAIRQLVPHLP
jgi:CheY-like chemotaxis protein